MEQCLRDLRSGRRAESFSVTYSDMHGLWGGVTITLAGSGAYERVERPMGASEPTATRGVLRARQVRAVAALLLELRAWEQRTPLSESLPLPDESLGTLEIRCGNGAARIAERHHELQAQQRVMRVRDQLYQLGEQLAGETFLRAQIARGDRNLLTIGLALSFVGAGLAWLFWHWFPAIFLAAGLLALAVWLRRRLLGGGHPIYRQLARFGDPQQLTAEVNREFAGRSPGGATYLRGGWLAQEDTYGVALVPWEAVVWLRVVSEGAPRRRRSAVEVWPRDGRRLAIPCGPGPEGCQGMLSSLRARAPWAEVGDSPGLEREWRMRRGDFLARVEARRAAMQEPGR